MASDPTHATRESHTALGCNGEALDDFHRHLGLSLEVILINASVSETM